MALSDLIVLALAAFFIWENLLPYAPFKVPPLVRAGAVFLLAFGLHHLDPLWVGLAAASGLVGILSIALGITHVPHEYDIPRFHLPRSRKAQLKRARRSRLPDLPNY